jgi:hypothetical protein
MGSAIKILISSVFWTLPMVFIARGGWGDWVNLLPDMAIAFLVGLLWKVCSLIWRDAK